MSTLHPGGRSRPRQPGSIPSVGSWRRSRASLTTMVVGCSLLMSIGGTSAVAAPSAEPARAAPLGDPAAVVEAWLDAIAAMDPGAAGELVCEASRTAYVARTDPRPALASLPDGVDGDALIAAFAVAITDRDVRLLGSDASTATVAIRGTLTMRLEEEAGRTFIRQLLSANATPVSEGLEGRLLPQLVFQLGGPAATAYGQRLDATVTLVREAGEWRICDDDRGYVSGRLTGRGRPLDARVFATVVTLQDGSVLIAGGRGEEGVLDSAEAFETDSATFVPVGTMQSAGMLRPGVLIHDGSVLVAGGVGADGRALASAESYDPDRGTFSSVGDLSEGRLGHGMSRLSDGDVLVTGGGAAQDTTDVVAARALAASTERFEGTAGTFSRAPSMSTPRYGHVQATLGDGRILIAGGSDGVVGLTSAEVYDDIQGGFADTGSMAAPRADGIGVVLRDGRVLIMGGVRASPPTAQEDYLASAELYDPVSGTFASVGPMAWPRRWASGTLLADGRVLVTGGRDAVGSLISAEVFDPRTGRFTSTGDLSVPGFGIGAALLPDGRVLVTGGANEFGVLRRAEAWDPDTGRFGPVERQSTDTR